MPDPRLLADRRFAIAGFAAWTLIAAGLGAAVSTGPSSERVATPTPRVIVVPAPAPTPEVVTRVREVVPRVCDESILELIDGYLKALAALEAIGAGRYDDPAIEAFSASIDDATRDGLMTKLDECLAYPRQ